VNQAASNDAVALVSAPARGAELETVEKFLDRELAFSLAVLSPDKEVRNEARLERKRQVFGDASAPSADKSVRKALTPMVGGLDRATGRLSLDMPNGPCLILAVQRTDIMDAKTILKGGKPVWRVAISDPDVRESPIAYLIANNLNAIRPDLAHLISREPDSFIVQGQTHCLALKCSVMAENAGKSKFPDKALATLKNAVDEGRYRFVSIEMTAEANLAHRSKLAIER